MSDLNREAFALQPQLTAWRRDFHTHPELSMQEHRTAGVIEAELEAIGIAHERVGGTGVLGILRGAQPGGRAVALRADIDALPIREQNETPYRSVVDGVMHACGHDAHPAWLLGAAKLLAARREAFGGEIRLLFQPGEEIGGGARDFLAAGALDGVQRVMGLHAASDLPVGVIGLKPGLNNAAVDLFRIRVQGKAAHVSTPELGADALYIASQIVVAVQALVTRRAAPVEPLLIGIGKLRAGTTYNAVAETAVLEGTTRTVSADTRARVRRQIDEVCEKIAAVYGGSAAVEWTDVTPALVNDPTATAEAAGTAQRLFGPGHVKTDRALSLGGDNFAEYQLSVPGVYGYVGTANPAKPATLSAHHNGRFDVDEDALPIGAALLAGCALHWLTREEAL